MCSYYKKNFKIFNIINERGKLTNVITLISLKGGGGYLVQKILHEILTCQSLDKNEAITILQCFVYAYTIYMYVCRKKMPGNGPKSYPCCVCKRRTDTAERFSIKAEYARLLEKQFCVLVNGCGVFVFEMYRLECYREENKRIANKPCLETDGNQATFDEFEPPTKQGITKCQTPLDPHLLP